ncbi:unnamed protein product [Brassica rapa]|uniref:Uncharacterized protein n=1 Tax=Brassica campestris TaxID=3711 RepID=A0A8D9HT32_BRACM|nr:unnamed protein product [Brassica rapa]
MIGVSNNNLMVMTCELRFDRETTLEISAVNASLVHILKYLTGSAKRPKTYANLTQVYVDVHNVALGHVMVNDTQRLRPLHLFQK